MKQPVLGSRALARLGAKTIVPTSLLGVRALVGAAQLITLMPTRLTAAVAKLNIKNIRLYDSMQAPDYPIPTA